MPAATYAEGIVDYVSIRIAHIFYDTLSRRADRPGVSLGDIKHDSHIMDDLGGDDRDLAAVQKGIRAVFPEIEIPAVDIEKLAIVGRAADYVKERLDAATFMRGLKPR